MNAFESELSVQLHVECQELNLGSPQLHHQNSECARVTGGKGVEKIWLNVEIGRKKMLALSLAVMIRRRHTMFEQLDDPKLAGRKSWKERITEGALILVVSAAVIGALVYAFIAVE
jgi:hypothetical protein